MRKARTTRRGPRVPDDERRVQFAVRIPKGLLSDFRALAGKAPGEITRVIEGAMRTYLRKHGGGRR